VSGQPKSLALLPHIIGGWIVSRAILDEKVLVLTAKARDITVCYRTFPRDRIILGKSLLSTLLLQALMLVLCEEVVQNSTRLF
jgi:hypothetical protein